MQKAKRIILGIVAVLAVVIAIQNKQTVDTKILFVTISMPRTVLILVTFLLGGAAGLFAGSRFGSRAKNA